MASSRLKAAAIRDIDAATHREARRLAARKSSAVGRGFIEERGFATRLVWATSSSRARPRWRNVLRIWLAETADASNRVEALLEGGEAAIHPAAHAAAAILCAPRIILGFRAGSHCKRSKEYSQDE